MRRIDAVVAGDGIAGCAAAIALARSGVGVGIVRQANAADVDLPETLAPGAIPLLDRLGLDVDLVERRFPRITSRLSRWGRGPMQYNDMLPRAVAPLLLGKSGLRALLWRKLRELGCEEFHADRIEDVGRLDCGMLVRLRPASAAGEPEILGRMIIDATGRGATVANRIGVRRHTYDSLVSFWISGATGGMLQQTTITFTVGDGWIFYSGAGAGRAAVGFFISGLHVGHKPSVASIVERARDVAEIENVFTSCPNWAASPVTTRNAATTVLERPSGPGWIACGDALQTIDPLTSSGNLQGISAAEAVKASFCGNQASRHGYGLTALRDFRELLKYRAGYYGFRS